MADDPAVALTPGELSTISDVLVDHDVRLAIVFGSAAHPDGEPTDIDLAIEFTHRKPTDDGYADEYLGLRAALEDALERAVDLVDVRSMPPPFAAVVFEDGVRVVGTEDRHRRLEMELAGERPSVAASRDRVAAAVDRLREGST